MTIQLLTLGDLRILAERDRSVTSQEDLATALLVYLGSVREASSAGMIQLLWSDDEPRSARRSMNAAIETLNQRLGEAWLEIDGDRLRTTGRLDVDARRFQAAVKEESYERALGLYRGPFLQGFSNPAGEGFELWMDRERSRLSDLHRLSLRGAIQDLWEGDELDAALERAEAWTGAYPDDEEGWFHNIVLLARAGDLSRALQRYQTYETRVTEEGGDPPSDRLREVAEKLRTGKIVVPRLRLEPSGGEPTSGTRPWSNLPARGPRLVRIVEAGEEGEAFPLKPGVTVIGRKAGDLVFPGDPLVSARHASVRLELAEEPGEDGEVSYRCIVRDEGSRNGVYRLVRDSTPLEDGDHLALGSQVFRFEIERDSGPMKRLD